MFTPPQRHSWLWAVLPLGTDTVAVPDDPDLARAVSEAGLGVAEDLAPVVLMTLRNGRMPRRAAVEEWLHGAEVVAVSVGGGRTEIRDRVSRPRRALERAATPFLAAMSWLTGRRIAEMLRGHGFAVSRLPVSDRSRGPVTVGSSLWKHHVIPLGVIVVGRMRRRPTVLEAVTSAAADDIGGALAVRRVRTVETGKVLLDVADDAGRRYVLRVAGANAAGFLWTSLGSVRSINALSRSPVLKDRLVQPIAHGAVGPVQYALEPWTAGAHPRRMTPALWEQCLEFLVELHRLQPGGKGPGRLVTDIQLLETYADEAGKRTLNKLRDQLCDRLADLTLGWGHGDFWQENLLTDGERLVAVLDWDTATPASLPMLDLMDLIALSRRRDRGLTPGPRLAGVLLPLIRAGEDTRIRAYCDATGVPPDRRTLEALALGYWIDRTARDLRDTPDRRVRPTWIAQNVRAPLSQLASWR